MKKFSITLVLTLLVCAFSYAQNVEKTFVPYYLEDGQVKEFERVSAKMETLAIGFGYGGANQYLTVFDNKFSDLRFKQGDMPDFIIKVDEGVDVFELVLISKGDKVKKRKKYRRFIQQGFNLGGGSKDMSANIVVPKFEEIGENLYKMTFDEPFEPGEYAFQPILKGTEAQNIISTSGRYRIYAFGVD